MTRLSAFPGETEEDFQQTLSLLDEVEYDAVFAFKYSPRPNTPSIKMEDAIPDEEKSRRLAVMLEKQRAIQKRRNQKHLGEKIEVMVEGKNEARNQWLGRTSQNKTLNFVGARGPEFRARQLRTSACNHRLAEQPGR